MAKRFRPEAPRVMEPGDRLYSLADKIADWVEDDDRKKGAWVAGVWGGRGTGKTSLLATVLDILSGRADSRGHTKVALPGASDPASSYEEPGTPSRTGATGSGPKSHDPDQLFCPSFGRDGEDLLFLLLRHLEEKYARPHSAKKDAERAFGAIRTAEVKRKDIQPFLDYEKEIAVSQTDFTRRFVEIHANLAAVTKDVRDEFGKLLRTFSPGGGRPLLLCVDDLDLRPDRTLDLLELFQHFLSHDGVIVLVAADRELMLLSIKEALSKRGLHKPALAGALLAKLIPYGWGLPVPSLAERMENLWSVAGPTNDDVLPAWWVRDPDASALARDEAESALSEVLPRTYRDLVAASNRLLSLQDELDAAGDTLVALSDAIRVRFGNFYLSGDSAPFLSGVILADVQMPELGLLDIFRFSPQLLVDELQLYGRRAYELQQAAGTSKPEQPQETHGIFSSMLASLGTGGTSALDGRRLLVGLIHLYETLSEVGQQQRADRFFAISMNNDAIARSESVWRGRITADAVNQWHLDLRDLAEGSLVSPENLRKARKRAFEHLETRGIRGFQGRVELFAYAKLSFLVWLGWEMRYVTQVIGINFDSGQFSRFEQQERLRFQDLPWFGWLQPAPALLTSSEVRDASGNAVLIVDTTGKSKAEQLGHFVGNPDEGPVQAIDAYRLVAPPGEVLQPSNLEAVLQDVIEVIGRLRHDRGTRRLHLGLAAPDVVAFFLGQQLNAQGMEIRLYEFYESQYRFVFQLDQNEP